MNGIFANCPKGLVSFSKIEIKNCIFATNEQRENYKSKEHKPMNLSKNQIKMIQSLQRKKGRTQTGLFLAEGIKVVQELLNSSFDLQALYVTEANADGFDRDSCEIISDEAFKKISVLKTPSGVLGVFKLAQIKELQMDGLVVALDTINDPGNLGTIIRLCDWFGVKQLLCSENTVDCYNSKVVQSTMGSLSRVQINYVNLKEVLEKTAIPKYVADLDGQNLYETALPKKGVVILGNESNGVSDALKKMEATSLTIPRFGSKTESLNVATATAILLSEFLRNQ